MSNKQAKRLSVITALATPYNDGGKIDINSYVRLCKHLQENGVDGALALGTTAEAQLLDDCEKKLLLTVARATCTSLPLIAGIEEPSTTKAVKEAKLYAELGADALMIAPPSFCKCTTEGYVKHVEAIRCASGLPIVLYNIPSRAGYGLDVNAVKQLAEKGYVRYVKDSSPNMRFAKEIAPYAHVLCGSDEKLNEYVDSGATGVISVVANVAPHLTQQALHGENCDSFRLLAQLAMLEINPIAIKYMLYKAGIFDSYEVRLPLTKASRQTQAKIDSLYECAMRQTNA